MRKSVFLHKSNVLFSLFICLGISFSCLHKKQKFVHGGCCLSQGTLVRLANGKDILIENMKAGDTVLAFNKTTERFEPSKVLKTFSTEHAGFVKMNFNRLMRNEVEVYPATSIIVSQDHPIWVKDKGWCSTQPEMTMRILMMKDVKKIVAGDDCYTNKDWCKDGRAGTAKLASVEKLSEIMKAYTIVKLDNGLDCFIANGIVVGTEAMSMQDGGD
ncbi:MAG: Hint domain-containing protein [Bacteroidia bacterium]